MTDNYGMQPAQPQYGANPNYGMTPVQDASTGYSTQAQYGAPPPQQQYGTQQQPNQYQQAQPNPYAASHPTTATGGDNEENPDKEIYAEKQSEEWVFTPEWDDAKSLKAKTACCCCNC